VDGVKFFMLDGSTHTYDGLPMTGKRPFNSHRSGSVQ